MRKAPQGQFWNVPQVDLPLYPEAKWKDMGLDGGAAMVALKGEGADKDLALQPCGSWAALRLLLSAAEDRECSLVRTSPVHERPGTVLGHPDWAQHFSAYFTSILCIHFLYSSHAVGFIPNFALTGSVIPIPIMHTLDGR